MCFNTNLLCPWDCLPLWMFGIALWEGWEEIFVWGANRMFGNGSKIPTPKVISLRGPSHICPSPP